MSAMLSLFRRCPNALISAGSVRFLRTERGDHNSRRRKDPTDPIEGLIVGDDYTTEVKRSHKRNSRQLVPSKSSKFIDYKLDFAVEKAFGPDDITVDDLGQIKPIDALGSYKDSEFNAEYLDSVGTGLQETFNIAALVEKVELLQKLVELNVELYKWDKNIDMAKQMLMLDWKKDCEPKINMLIQRTEMPPEGLSRVLSKYPLMLTLDKQHLEARIDFIGEICQNNCMDMARIAERDPLWLSFPITKLEERIKIFKDEFRLNQSEFTQIVINCPKVITYGIAKIKDAKFSFHEELGFDQKDVKQIILQRPSLLLVRRENLRQRFDLLHNTIGYSHEILAAHPSVLSFRETKTLARHKFLCHLGRNQYDPKKPGYVSVMSLVTGVDEIFVTDVAKSTMEQFEAFLKNQ